MMMHARDDSSYLAYTTEWMRLINRRGLYQVNNMSYLLFREIELEFRKHVRSSNLQMGHLSSRDNVIRAIVENDNILFQWCLLATDLEEAEEQQLLPMIVELYVTTRGFSFAKFVA